VSSCTPAFALGYFPAVAIRLATLVGRPALAAAVLDLGRYATAAEVRLVHQHVGEAAFLGQLEGLAPVEAAAALTGDGVADHVADLLPLPAAEERVRECSRGILIVAAGCGGTYEAGKKCDK
jgi:hypothetical protein